MWAGVRPKANPAKKYRHPSRLGERSVPWTPQEIRAAQSVAEIAAFPGVPEPVSYGQLPALVPDPAKTGIGMSLLSVKW
jgi:hypothetical protein